MTVHLLKMAAGIKSLDHLRRRQAQARKGTIGGREALIHITRNYPRRAEEVLDGGSLYWIVKRHVLGRNRIIGLDRAQTDDGRPRCHIYLDPDLVPVMPVRRRPIQGWRYLQPADAPADLAEIGISEGEEPLPPEMASELRALGLI